LKSSGPLSKYLVSARPEVIVHRFRPDIKKFGKVLKIIKALEPFFALISVTAMLNMFGFSKVRFMV